MGSIKLPQAQLSELPPIRKKNSQTDLIMQVLGQNPFAGAIDSIGTDITDALTRRAEIRRQAQEVSDIEGAFNVPPGSFGKGTKSDVALALAKNIQDRGTPTTLAIVNPEGDVSPFDVPAGKKYGGSVRLPAPPALATRGSTQQTSYVDSADGTPLFFDRNSQSYIRSNDQGLPKGEPVPSKGQGEAVQSSSRALEILPKIDTLFDSLDAKTELGARTSLAPGISKVFYPEINQLKNEILQVGFTFGGKNFTGTEKDIIVDALVPGPFDNKNSRQAKRAALKGYVSGQINLLDAANLLGPAGSKIKEVISKGAESPAQRKARLLKELGESK